MTDDKLTDAGKTRQLIKEELDAQNSYEQMAAETKDKDAKKLYLDIKREEGVHAGELLAILDKQDPKAVPDMKEGVEEAIEKSAFAKAPQFYDSFEDAASDMSQYMQAFDRINEELHSLTPTRPDVEEIIAINEEIVDLTNEIDILTDRLSYARQVGDTEYEKEISEKLDDDIYSFSKRYEYFKERIITSPAPYEMENVGQAAIEYPKLIKDIQNQMKGIWDEVQEKLVSDNTTWAEEQGGDVQEKRLDRLESMNAAKYLDERYDWKENFAYNNPLRKYLGQGIDVIGQLHDNSKGTTNVPQSALTRTTEGSLIPTPVGDDSKTASIEMYDPTHNRTHLSRDKNLNPTTTGDLFPFLTAKDFPDRQRPAMFLPQLVSVRSKKINGKTHYYVKFKMPAKHASHFDPKNTEGKTIEEGGRVPLTPDEAKLVAVGGDAKRVRHNSIWGNLLPNSVVQQMPLGGRLAQHRSRERYKLGGKDRAVYEGIPIAPIRKMVIDGTLHFLQPMSDGSYMYAVKDEKGKIELEEPSDADVLPYGPITTDVHGNLVQKMTDGTYCYVEEGDEGTLSLRHTGIDAQPEVKEDRTFDGWQEIPEDLVDMSAAKDDGTGRLYLRTLAGVRADGTPVYTAFVKKRFPYSISNMGKAYAYITRMFPDFDKYRDKAIAQIRDDAIIKAGMDPRDPDAIKRFMRGELVPVNQADETEYTGMSYRDIRDSVEEMLFGALLSGNEAALDASIAGGDTLGVLKSTWVQAAEKKAQYAVGHTITREVSKRVSDMLSRTMGRRYKVGIDYDRMGKPVVKNITLDANVERDLTARVRQEFRKRAEPIDEAFSKRVEAVLGDTNSPEFQKELQEYTQNLIDPVGLIVLSNASSQLSTFVGTGRNVHLTLKGSQVSFDGIFKDDGEPYFPKEGKEKEYDDLLKKINVKIEMINEKFLSAVKEKIKRYGIEASLRTDSGQTVIEHASYDENLDKNGTLKNYIEKKLLNELTPQYESVFNGIKQNIADKYGLVIDASFDNGQINIGRVDLPISTIALARDAIEEKIGDIVAAVNIEFRNNGTVEAIKQEIGAAREPYEIIEDMGWEYSQGVTASVMKNIGQFWNDFYKKNGLVESESLQRDGSIVNKKGSTMTVTLDTDDGKRTIILDDNGRRMVNYILQQKYEAEYVQANPKRFLRIGKYIARRYQEAAERAAEDVGMDAFQYMRDYPREYAALQRDIESEFMAMGDDEQDILMDADDEAESQIDAVGEAARAAEQAAEDDVKEKIYRAAVASEHKAKAEARIQAKKDADDRFAKVIKEIGKSLVNRADFRDASGKVDEEAYSRAIIEAGNAAYEKADAYGQIAVDNIAEVNRTNAVATEAKERYKEDLRELRSNSKDYNVLMGPLAKYTEPPKTYSGYDMIVDPYDPKADPAEAQAIIDLIKRYFTEENINDVGTQSMGKSMVIFKDIQGRIGLDKSSDENLLKYIVQNKYLPKILTSLRLIIPHLNGIDPPSLEQSDAAVNRNTINRANLAARDPVVNFLTDRLRDLKKAAEANTSGKNYTLNDIFSTKTGYDYVGALNEILTYYLSANGDISAMRDPYTPWYDLGRHTPEEVIADLEYTIDRAKDDVEETTGQHLVKRGYVKGADGVKRITSIPYFTETGRAMPLMDPTTMKEILVAKTGDSNAVSAWYKIALDAKKDIKKAKIAGIAGYADNSPSGPELKGSLTQMTPKEHAEAFADIGALYKDRPVKKMLDIAHRRLYDALMPLADKMGLMVTDKVSKLKRRAKPDEAKEILERIIKESNSGKPSARGRLNTLKNMYSKDIEKWMSDFVKPPEKPEDESEGKPVVRPKVKPKIPEPKMPSYVENTVNTFYTAPKEGEPYSLNRENYLFTPNTRNDKFLFKGRKNYGTDIPPELASVLNEYERKGLILDQGYRTLRAALVEVTNTLQDVVLELEDKVATRDRGERKAYGMVGPLKGRIRSDSSDFINKEVAQLIKERDSVLAWQGEVRRRYLEIKEMREKHREDYDINVKQKYGLDWLDYDDLIDTSRSLYQGRDYKAAVRPLFKKILPKGKKERDMGRTVAGRPAELYRGGALSELVQEGKRRSSMADAALSEAGVRNLDGVETDETSQEFAAKKREDEDNSLLESGESWSNRVAGHERRIPKKVRDEDGNEVINPEYEAQSKRISSEADAKRKEKADAEAEKKKEDEKVVAVEPTSDSEAEVYADEIVGTKDANKRIKREKEKSKRKDPAKKDTSGDTGEPTTKSALDTPFRDMFAKSREGVINKALGR